MNRDTATGYAVIGATILTAGVALLAGPAEDHADGQKGDPDA